MTFALVTDITNPDKRNDLGPLRFARIPNLQEYLWLDDRPFIVVNVTHSWDQDGVPGITLEISAAA